MYRWCFLFFSFFFFFFFLEDIFEVKEIHKVSGGIAQERCPFSSH